ncbi:maleate cis-trans isomerase family protein [Rhodovibrionaceae bacterium A322]
MTNTVSFAEDATGSSAPESKGAQDEGTRGQDPGPKHGGASVPVQVSPPRQVDFDAGRHDRAKIGFVLLASEQTIQDDVMAFRPPGVGMHFARLISPDEITNATLQAQIDQLAGCASSMLPDGSLDVICYGCTSGSLVMGEKQVLTELSKGAPNARPTSLITSVIRAMRQLQARKIVVATPYLDEINQREKDYLEAAGFDVLTIQGLNLEKDSDMVRVTPAFIRDFALSLDQSDADAIFVSCGALRSLEVIGEIERLSGKPAICSNQAMIWDCLRLAGLNDRFGGHGRLLSDY